jgi:hypothetical protein
LEWVNKGRKYGWGRFEAEWNIGSVIVGKQLEVDKGGRTNTVVVLYGSEGGGLVVGRGLMFATLGVQKYFGGGRLKVGVDFEAEWNVGWVIVGRQLEVDKGGRTNTVVVVLYGSEGGGLVIGRGLMFATLAVKTYFGGGRLKVGVDSEADWNVEWVIVGKQLELDKEGGTNTAVPHRAMGANDIQHGLHQSEY